MPNIARMLKNEIQRLARHEIKVATIGLRKDNSVLKRTVADLKRRLAKMETTSKRLVAKAEANQPGDADITDGKVKSARITAKMIRSIRERLGLSQDAFAKLLGVSSQSIYHWERKNGRLALRGEGKARIVAIRQMGKREAKKRLEEIASN